MKDVEFDKGGKRLSASFKGYKLHMDRYWKEERPWRFYCISQQ